MWDVLDAFDEVDVVFLDASTGAGKTLIAVLVAMELRLQTTYVASGKTLQDQFARDFPYAAVLKGRSNYGVTSGDPNFTAADCVAGAPQDPCWHCPDGGKAVCPYEVAKRTALESWLCVMNTSYLLAEANFIGRFSDRELIVVDEADVLEGELMSFIEYRIPRVYMEMAKIEPPKKGSRKKTLVAWLEDYADTLHPLMAAEQDIKRKKALNTSIMGARRMMRELTRDIELRQSEDESNGMWLREYEEDKFGNDVPSLILKPVIVSNHGLLNLWRHGWKWLIMSATIISADDMADSLGLSQDYRVVTVPSTFPPDQRPIIMAPVANMTSKDMWQGGAVEDLLYACQQIVQYHPGESVLIHAVSYKLADKIARGLRSGEFAVPRSRHIVEYRTGKDRDFALQRFIDHPGAILVAPSMERGIDLPDDLCRVQIVAKCPFPALQGTVSARTHLPNGNRWYAVKTIRDLVQMCGRGMRHEGDWCTTYILDRQFSSNLWMKWKQVFPRWFQDAVVTNADIRWLMRPRRKM